MGFPDAATAVLEPGKVAPIDGGSFYQLHNSGDGPMIFMGTRTVPHGADQHIDYETKRDRAGMRRTRGGGEESSGAPMAKEGEERATGGEE